jgi:Flp pilus assembly CpaE family ATPase
MCSETIVIGLGESALADPSVDSMAYSHPAADDFLAVLKGALLRKQQNDFTKLLAFLPAKAGSGCSCIVLNTAAALHRENGMRVAVLDCDLRSSVLSSMTGITPANGTEQMLARIEDLSVVHLEEFLHPWQGVDLILSRRSFDTSPPHWGQYLQLLRLLGSRYDWILMDLPELVNPATVEMVRHARRVFAVCTPELASLTLAKQRLEELERLKIPASQVGLLVNRWHRSDPRPTEIAEILRYPVSHVFPNDYYDMKDAITNGTVANPATRLGTAFREFSCSLTPPSNAIIKPVSVTSKLRNLLRIA